MSSLWGTWELAGACVPESRPSQEGPEEWLPKKAASSL